MTIRLMTFLAAGCGLSGFLAFAPAALAAPTQYPLILTNCGQQVEFNAAPKRIVTIGQAVTEVIYALGAGDRLTGTALWFTDVLPEYKAQNDRVPRISDTMPSFESVLEKRPELAATQFEWMIGPQGAVGTRPQFQDLGVNTYIMPADCVGKDNLVGGDGTRLTAYTTDLLYQGIDDLGQILDRQEQAAVLASTLRNREAAVISKAKTLNLQDISAAVWFSSAEMDMDPYMAGAKSEPAYLLKTLGIRNVVTSDEEWPTVGWETIARANPTVLILAKMERRRFPADDVNEKIKFLKSDPVTAQLEAVKNNRIIILDADELQSGIRLITGLEKLTAGMGDLAP